MKKVILIFGIGIAIISSIYYLYMTYSAEQRVVRRENRQFEQFMGRENISGNQMATIMNKAMDRNNRNNVEIDRNGMVVENNTNSIRIQIRMTDIDETFNMESFYNNNNMVQFRELFSTQTFRGVEIQYHEATNRVRYMLFEQIESATQ